MVNGIQLFRLAGDKDRPLTIQQSHTQCCHTSTMTIGGFRFLFAFYLLLIVHSFTIQPCTTNLLNTQNFKRYFQ